MSLRSYLVSTAVIAVALAAPVAAHGETLNGALAKAYENNSSLNSARAGVRVTDEGVAIAKSGYRPSINGQLSWTYSSTHTNTAAASVSTRSSVSSVAVSIDQSLFDGFQTTNNVRAATSQVYAARENLRNTTQTVLFDAVQAYMNVLRNRQIAVLRGRNIDFLSEQLRAASVRLEVGEGTRTDVAQADASLAGARAQLNAARADVQSAEAIYRQIILTDPKDLKMPAPYKGAMTNFDSALGIAISEHPAIMATQHVADAYAFQVKSAEGALLPQLSARAAVSATDNNISSNSPTAMSSDTTSASVGVTLNVPIYQGGRASAQVRRAKEQLGQGRIDIDAVRDNVRAAVASAISQYTAATASVSANRQLVSAAQLALNGVVEERRVGQRTTLDVLNAQSDLISAQINQVNSQADAVVASYAVLSAMGRLTPGKLGLGVREHNPEEHFNAVKDMWFGLRTPDGR